MQRKGTDEERVRAFITRMVSKYAERSPFFLNPDEILVKNVVAGLVRNKMKYGYAYCPCREVKGDSRRGQRQHMSLPNPQGRDREPRNL